jgi:hypothetical protein
MYAIVILVNDMGLMYWHFFAHLDINKIIRSRIQKILNDHFADEIIFTDLLVNNIISETVVEIDINSLQLEWEEKR